MDPQGKAKVALTFALYQGEQLIRRETIAQDIVKVGKDPKSHLRIDDDAASRMHAVIEVGGPDDITLIDLGNDPGTVVNGARVNKCKLEVGDRIEIGATLILLEAAEDAGDAEPAAAAAAPQMPRGAVASNPFAAAGGGANPLAAAPNPFGGGPAPPSPFRAAPNPFGRGRYRAAPAPAAR